MFYNSQRIKTINKMIVSNYMNNNTKAIKCQSDFVSCGFHFAEEEEAVLEFKSTDIFWPPGFSTADRGRENYSKEGQVIGKWNCARIDIDWNKNIM